MFRRKLLKIALIVVGVPLVCFGGYWAWYGADLLLAANDLPHQIARARALGLPFQGKDLRPNPPVKDEENAAVPIRALIKRWRAWPPETKIWSEHDRAVTFGQAPPPLTVEEMKPLEPYFRTLRDISYKTRCDFAYDMDRGVWRLYPEVAGLGAFRRVMLVHVDALTRAGRDNEAIAELETIRRLGRLVKQDSTPLCVLSGVGHEISARQGYWRIAGLCSGRLATLRKVRRALDSVNSVPDYGAIVRGDVADAMAMVRIVPNAEEAYKVQNPEGWSAPEPAVFPKEPEPKTLVRKAYMARVLRQYCDCAEAWKRGPDPDRFVAAVKAIEKRYASYRGPSYALVPYFGEMGATGWATSRTYNLAQERLARAYVEVLIYRAERGRLPATLAQAGLNEVDPFDGAPLRYTKRLDGSFLIWSVGADGVDDGGTKPPTFMGMISPKKWKEESSRPPKGDIVMEYPPAQEP